MSIALPSSIASDVQIYSTCPHLEKTDAASLAIRWSTPAKVV
jgi:hypothetical protein